MGWRQWVTSAGSVALAFLASQHHNLHMLLLLLGLSAASTSFLTANPLLRRGMLLMSLLLTALTAYNIRRHKQAGIIRTLSELSILISLGFIAWTVYQFGL